MTEQDIFHAEFQRNLPVGEVLESRASASSSSNSAGAVSRAEMRYVFAPEEGKKVDLERAVENVVVRAQGRGVEVSHEQTQREPGGGLLIGRILYTSYSATGELDYRLVHDEESGRVEVELSTRERGR